MHAGYIMLRIVLGAVMILAPMQNYVELRNMAMESQAIASLGQSAAAEVNAAKEAALIKVKATTDPTNTTTAAANTTTTSKAVTRPTSIQIQQTPAAKTKNPNDIFVVGIMFSKAPRYIDSLQAEVDTWMTEIDMNRTFAVGPKDAIAHKTGFPRVTEERCPDRSLWCKRISHILGAYNLLKSGTHFDWLLSGNEDWYVNLPAMREALSAKNPNDPVVYASMGCDFAWQHNPSSENGTKPMPKGYRVNPKTQCEGLSKGGGVCGGYGVVFSRGAIEAMMQEGEKRLFDKAKIGPFDWSKHPQDDTVLSCLVYSFAHKGVRMEERPWIAQDSRWIIKNGKMEFRGKSIGASHGVPFEGIDGAGILRKLYDVQKSQQ